jgi:hypothetical protein
MGISSPCVGICSVSLCNNRLCQSAPIQTTEPHWHHIPKIKLILGCLSPKNTTIDEVSARVGRAGRTFALGYKLHLSIDSKSMLPLTSLFASANQNEKKHSLTLLEKTRQILGRSRAELRSVIADSQYSDGKIRMAVDEAVIPYSANQKRGVENLLRVDKKFRTYGPEDEKKEYHKRPHIEAVNSFLKTQYSMALNKVRGLKSVASYALYSILCLVLNREATQNLGRADKAVSPTYFNT